MQEKGFIKIVIENRNQRKIYLAADIGNEEKLAEHENNVIGYEDIFTGGHENNFTHNIINNKIDRLFNYIIKKEKQIPKEFEVYEEKILDVIKRFEMNYSKSALISMSEENIEKVKIICFCLAMLVKENVGHLL